MASPDRLLLVEDDSDDVALIRAALEEAGAAVEVHAVSDGRDALTWLRDVDAARLPQLVLLDLNLPGLAGLRVLEELKATPELRRIPVVVLTTSSAPADVTTAYDNHANAYLRKPVTFSQLVDVLRATTEFWLRAAVRPFASNNRPALGVDDDIR